LVGGEARSTDLGEVWWPFVLLPWSTYGIFSRGWFTVIGVCGGHTSHVLTRLVNILSLGLMMSKESLCQISD
jgi:hypothetical protein